MASSDSAISAAAAWAPANSISVPPGMRGPGVRSAWPWFVNMSKTRPGVAIA